MIQGQRNQTHCGIGRNRTYGAYALGGLDLLCTSEDIIGAFSRCRKQEIPYKEGKMKDIGAHVGYSILKVLDFSSVM